MSAPPNPPFPPVPPPELYCGLVKRWPVPPSLRPWTQAVADYKPTEFELDFTGKEWADPPDPRLIRFNALDGHVDRRSHVGAYRVHLGYPLNPTGRTGVRLRGLLGRWGEWRPLASQSRAHRSQVRTTRPTRWSRGGCATPAARKWSPK